MKGDNPEAKIQMVYPATVEKWSIGEYTHAQKSCPV